MHDFCSCAYQARCRRLDTGVALIEGETIYNAQAELGGLFNGVPLGQTWADSPVGLLRSQ